MADELHVISAPALNQSFGSNVKNTFDNINSNFGVLANNDLVQGPKGDSLVSLNVPFSKLLNDDNNFTHDGYIIPGQKTNFINMFKTVKESLSGITIVNPNQDDDIARAINKLKDSNRFILIGFDSPANASTAITIKTTIPYVYVDDVFRMVKLRRTLRVLMIFQEQLVFIQTPQIPQLILGYANKTFQHCIMMETMNKFIGS